MSKPQLFFLQNPLLPGFGLSFGFSVFYLSLVILLPLSALLLYVSDMSWAQYWQAISDPRVVQTYKVTISAAFYSTLAVLVLAGLLARWGIRVGNALVFEPRAHVSDNRTNIIPGVAIARGDFRTLSEEQSAKT